MRKKRGIRKKKKKSSHVLVELREEVSEQVGLSLLSPVSVPPLIIFLFHVHIHIHSTIFPLIFKVSALLIPMFSLWFPVSGT